ncbi:hypothetical protein [Konateibacter massiliensis]|uniref:hypothetical protein n=1 Tax=Konateibacter massiliensis TaxID=2002841 RepID=UPI000C148D4A|nr:hypothetical protein [Konateibacter massiliensis]
MPLYVTGQIVSTDRRTEAFKIYNSETKKSMLLAREDVTTKLLEGYKIIGLKLYRTENYDYAILNSKITGITSLSRLNGAGEREHKNKQTLVLIELRGFKERVKILCVDAEDNLHLLKLDEIKDYLTHDTIIGVKKVTDEKLTPHALYNNRAY